MRRPVGSSQTCTSLGRHLSLLALYCSERVSHKCMNLWPDITNISSSGFVSWKFMFWVKVPISWCLNKSKILVWYKNASWTVPLNLSSCGQTSGLMGILNSRSDEICGLVAKKASSLVVLDVHTKTDDSWVILAVSVNGERSHLKAG
jgi:hypothetical protein